MSIEFKFVVGIETPEYEAQMPEGQQVPWPFDSLVMYVLDDGKIVGRMGSMSIKFIEGTWANRSHPTLGLQMIEQMEAMLAYLGETHSMALAYDEQPSIGRYLKMVGYEKFPVTVFSKELIKKSEAA